MFRFLINRLLQGLAVIFTVIVLTFTLVRLTPGGPFTSERKAAEVITEQINAYYGLDKPVPVQFWNYLKGLVHGDLGPSYKYEGRTVNEIISGALPVSLQIGLLALTIAVLAGIPLGVYAASRYRKAGDTWVLGLALTGICLPSFVSGPLLALFFGLELGWFNTAGWQEWSDLVLPAMTLALFTTASLTRMMRAGMLETIAQDYIRMARAKGLSERTILWKHALRSALAPVVSYMGPAAAGLISGSFIVETTFQIPGIGQHFVSAALNNDRLLVMGTVVVFAVLIVSFNLLVDLLLLWLDPRTGRGK